MNKLNIKSITHEQLVTKSTNEQLSLSAILSAAFGLKNIFVTHEILLPNRKDSSPHYHSRKEELIFVLEGRLVLHIGEQVFELEAGDFMGIPPLTAPHYVENLTDQIVQFLKICSNHADDIVKFAVPDQLILNSKS